MEAFLTSLTTAITGVFGIVSDCLDQIIATPVLMLFLGASFVPLGFRIFRSAKRAAR